MRASPSGSTARRFQKLIRHPRPIPRFTPINNCCLLSTWGKVIDIAPFQNPGIPALGVSEVLQALGTIYECKSGAKPAYEAFSSRGAMSYSQGIITFDFGSPTLRFSL
jgi:hypothetical protein